MRRTGRCTHIWETRADHEPGEKPKFQCRKCGARGRGLSPRFMPHLPFDEERRNAASAFDEDTNLERRVYTDRYGFPQWTGLSEDS